MSASRPEGGFWQDAVLVGRVRSVLWLAVMASAALTAFGIVLKPLRASVLVGLGTVPAAVSLAGLWLLRKRPTPSVAVPVALTVLALVLGSAAAWGALAEDPVTTPVLAMFLAAGAAVLLPWGWRTQALASAVAAGAVLLNGSLVHGSSFLVGDLSTITAGAGLAICIYLAYELERYRRALAREARHARDEATVSGALAEVARDLIPALGTPELLARLCKRTTEILGCDCSHTFLFEGDHFVPVAQYGETSARWESMRLLRVPSGTVSAFLDRLRRDEVVEWRTSESGRDPVSRLTAGYGIRLTLAVPLRRDNRVFGMHTASYRREDASFDTVQTRIAAGLGQIASLALENARLVERLEQADRIKSDFVSGMSHELRTPIHVILGYHELLLDGVFGELNPEQRETLRRADLSARSLLELINATLDLGRYDDRRIPLEIRDVRLTEVTDEVARENPAPPDRRRLRVVWNIPPDLPVLRTDPVKLKIALKNLVENAIKFTPEGEVRICAWVEADWVLLEVRDTGVGISPGSLQLIFEPFRRGDDEFARRAGGVGLGLFLVRRIVDILGGSVTVESRPGHGSTFRLRLPLRPPRDGVSEPRDGAAGKTAYPNEPH